MVSAERVVAELVQMAFLDPGEIVAPRLTSPGDIGQLPAHVRTAIVGWKYDRFGNFIIELANKQVALEMLAKHLGLYHQDRRNDGDTPGELLNTALWRFVISMHVHQGVSVAEALVQALRHPEAVEAWARGVGLRPG